MLARIFHTICSIWLAVLLLFGTTPAAAIHRFANHQDTVHHHDHRGPVAEPQHHHCQFLSFELMPFEAAPALTIFAPFIPRPEHHFLTTPAARIAMQCLALPDGRAPPFVA